MLDTSFYEVLNKFKRVPSCYATNFRNIHGKDRIPTSLNLRSLCIKQQTKKLSIWI